MLLFVWFTWLAEKMVVAEKKISGEVTAYFDVCCTSEQCCGPVGTARWRRCWLAWCVQCLISSTSQYSGRSLSCISSSSSLSPWRNKFVYVSAAQCVVYQSARVECSDVYGDTHTSISLGSTSPLFINNEAVHLAQVAELINLGELTTFFVVLH